MPQSLVQIYVHLVFSTKHRQPFFRDPSFHWQEGYGAFSVSPSHVDTLKAYIANQPEHHKQETFQEEFRRICRKYGINIDERYVWD